MEQQVLVKCECGNEYHFVPKGRWEINFEKECVILTCECGATFDLYTIGKLQIERNNLKKCLNSVTLESYLPALTGDRNLSLE